MSGKSWDKLILLVVGLAVVGVSVLFVMKALAFPEHFVMEEAVPKNDLPDTQEGIANAAKAFVEKTQAWTNLDKGDPPAPLPLLVSVPIVEANGVIIRMNQPGDQPLRPPVTNAWLTTHNLDYLNSGVLGQDPDGDGFTSLAEWEAKTSPVDPKSHPPYAEKLIFASRQQEVYLLRFAAKPDATRFQINRLPSAKWPRGENFYIRVGEVSGDQQFRVDGYEERKAQSAQGIQVDASVVKITYLPKSVPVELVRNVDTPIPTYYAEMKFELDPQFKQYVKEGDAFSLTADPGTKYRVVKVEEDSVEISYQSGSEPEQTIQISKK